MMRTEKRKLSTATMIDTTLFCFRMKVFDVTVVGMRRYIPNPTNAVNAMM